MESKDMSPEAGLCFKSPDILERIEECQRRIRMRVDGMRIPAEPSDTDLVLVDAARVIESLRTRLAAAERERDEARGLLMKVNIGARAMGWSVADEITTHLAAAQAQPTSKEAHDA